MPPLVYVDNKTAMNIVYELGYDAPHLKQVLMSGACWWSVVDAKDYLVEKAASVYKLAASVVCGTYVFFDRQKDYVYCVARQAAKKQQPMINDYDRSLMIGTLSTVTESVVQSRVDEICSDESKTGPPIYDADLMVAGVYSHMAFNQDMVLKVGDRRAAKPLILYGNCTEEEAFANLRREDAALADNLIRFICFVFDQTVDPSRVQLDSAFVSGTRYDEEQFVLIRSQLPEPFNQWRAGRGTVGIVLDMDHPVLGQRTYAITNAHVVFNELNTATAALRDRFNAVVRFAHYDEHVDFCMLELCAGVTRMQNIVDAELSPTLFDAVDPRTTPPGGHAGRKVVKYGQKSSLTFGQLTHVDGRIGPLHGVLVGAAKPFTKPGDSGSVYLVHDEATGIFVPFALHRAIYADLPNPGATAAPLTVVAHAYVGSDLVRCLQTFVQKMTNA